MARTSKVERELFNLKDWSESDLQELRLKLTDRAYSEQEEAREQAKLIPLEGSSQELEQWLKKDGQLRGISTGYWTLDRMTAGLCGGDLDIVAAPSSVGKTLLCVNMAARQIALGYKVAFITLEMSKRSIMQRLYSIMTPTYYDALMQDRPLLVQAQDRIPYKSIRYAVEQAKEWGADVFYIDHLHYFSRDMQNQAEGLGMITQEFKLVAKEFDIPIVLVSQLRKTEGMRPTGDDLRGSALIKQDADIVLILDRNYEKIDPLNFVRVTLDKNRDRLIWSIDSEIELEKKGLDLVEPRYSAEIDATRDVKRQARGDERCYVSFRE